MADTTALIRATIVLTQAQRRYLEDQATKHDTSLSWVVRRMVNTEMEKPPAGRE